MEGQIHINSFVGRRRPRRARTVANVLDYPGCAGARKRHASALESLAGRYFDMPAHMGVGVSAAIRKCLLADWIDSVRMRC